MVIEVTVCPQVGSGVQDKTFSDVKKFHLSKTTLTIRKLNGMIAEFAIEKVVDFRVSGLKGV